MGTGRASCLPVTNATWKRDEDAMNNLVLVIATVALALPSEIACAQSVPSPQAKEETNARQQLERTLKDQVLISTRMPAVRLTFEKDFKYVGGQAFILYGVARAEQHFFVDADD